MRTLLYVLAALTFLGLFCSSHVSAALYNDWDDQEKQVFNIVNQQRSHRGFQDLVPDSRLHVAADLHSQDMAENDYFNHDSLDGTEFWERVLAQNYNYKSTGENIAAGYPNAHSVMYGTDDLTRLNDFDLRLGNGGFSGWDEVGQDWSDADWEAWDRVKPPGWVEGDPVDGYGGWMGSTGHRKNILSANFTDLGVGYYYIHPDPGNIENLFHYWTQDFASGDSAPVPIPPALFLFGSGLIGIVGLRRYKR